jgi:hypothetical protein
MVRSVCCFVDPDVLKFRFRIDLTRCSGRREELPPVFRIGMGPLRSPSGNSTPVRERETGDRQPPLPVWQTDVRCPCGFHRSGSCFRASWGALVEKTTVTALEILAEDMLCGSRTFDPWNEPDRVLAVLSQRFALDVLPGRPHSLPALDTGIVTHLRYLHHVSGDRRWRKTSYPSEPFLSHVAANLLGLRCNDSTREQRLQQGILLYTVKLVPALRMLAGMMREGVVDKYKDGELISRILLSSCRDLVVRDTYLPPARKTLGRGRIERGNYVAPDKEDSGT